MPSSWVWTRNVGGVEASTRTSAGVYSSALRPLRMPLVTAYTGTRKSGLLDARSTGSSALSSPGSQRVPTATHRWPPAENPSMPSRFAAIPNAAAR